MNLDRDFLSKIFMWVGYTTFIGSVIYLYTILITQETSRFSQAVTFTGTLLVIVFSTWVALIGQKIALRIEDIADNLEKIAEKTEELNK